LYCAQQWTLAAFIKNCAQLQKIIKWTFISLLFSQALCLFHPFVPFIFLDSQQGAKISQVMISAFSEMKEIEQENGVWSQLGIWIESERERARDENWKWKSFDSLTNC
jgi:hypothetical protein